MKLWILGLLALVMAGPLQLQAQPEQHAPLVVAAGHTSFIVRPGVTAAYSMDTSVVAAEAVAGGFQITGNGAGQTTVMLVTIQGVRTIAVMVPEPRLPGQFGAAQGDDAAEQTVDFGDEELLYNNDPTQITDVHNLTQISGDRQIHIDIMNTNIFPAEGQNPVGFPMLTYEISRPGQRITFVDEMMENTQLTLNGILLRGFHLQKGPWEFHGGITAITEFQDFLLPSTRYEVGGVSRHFELSKRTLFEANFYYFATNTAVNPTATPGPLATLFFKHEFTPHSRLTAEIGAGRGYASAGKYVYDDKQKSIEADFQYLSPNAASLNLDAFHGRLINISGHDSLGLQSQFQLYANDTQVNMPGDLQTFDTATLQDSTWVTKHAGFTGGLTAARFLSITPAASPVRSVGFLGGPQVQWKHWGGAFVYQDLRNSSSTPSSISYMYSAQTMFGSVSISAFYDLQSETPVFAPVQSVQPALQQTLFYESNFTRNPAQMVALIHQITPLTNQGFVNPMVVTLAATRTQYGATMNWAGKKAGQFAFNALVNSSVGGGTPSVRLATAGVMWTRKLGAGSMINAGFSMYRSTVAGLSSLQPIEQFSYRRQLNSIPHWIVPGHRAPIQGHVFIDQTFAQDWKSGDPPLAGIVVFLDGRRSTRTDSEGHYIFHSVPYGDHLVEAEYHGGGAFFFTSSSPKTVPSGATADFGISFAKGRIFGKFTNDAGTGMAVGLEIEGRGIHRSVTTSGDGTIEIDGLPDGTYTVHPIPSTLPPGYSIATLDDLQVAVAANQAGHFAFKAQALRSIAGTVQIRDLGNGTLAPLPGVEVSISELHRSVHTDREGRYLFRQLPAGQFTVNVVYAGKIYSHPVLLTDVPDAENAIDFTIAIPSAHPAISSPPLSATNQARK